MTPAVPHPSAARSTVPALVNDVLRSRGRPLDSAVRALMEGRFGHDFSRVRVHTGARAAASARALGARAYTVGRHVVFAAGQYAPHSPAGRQLLAHELAHVVQQSLPGQPAGELTLGPPDDAAEREAERVAAAVAAGGRAPAIVVATPPTVVQRVPQKLTGGTTQAGVENIPDIGAGSYTPGPPTAPTPTPAPAPPKPPSTGSRPPIAAWSFEKKLTHVLFGALKYLPPNLAQMFQRMLSPENIAIMVGGLGVWATSHFFGVGEVVDVLFLLGGAAALGYSAGGVARNFYEFLTTTLNAQSEADLERASKALAQAVVEGGMDAVMAVLLHRTATGLQAARGASIRAVIRPRQPGLISLRGLTWNVPRQSGWWYRPTIIRDPGMPAASGISDWLGNMRISSAGTAAEQQVASVHELVHSLLRPRLAFLRTFRMRLAASAYYRSAFMQATEEALAETVGQLRAYGLSGLMNGVSFPVSNGYVTLGALATEGAHIGSVALGTQWFSLGFTPGPPDGGNP